MNNKFLTWVLQVFKMWGQTPTVRQVVASLKPEHVVRMFLACGVYAEVAGNAGFIVAYVTSPPLAMRVRLGR